jgi:hypothetical protein
MNRTYVYFAATALGTFGGWLAACSNAAPSGPSEIPESDAGHDAGPDGNIPGSHMGDGGGGTNDGAACDDAGRCAFGAPCSSPTQCIDNACFIGGSRSYCSKHCTIPTQVQDCPKPTYEEVCNNQGYCRY